MPQYVIAIALTSTGAMSLHSEFCYNRFARGGGDWGDGLSDRDAHSGGFSWTGSFLQMTRSTFPSQGRSFKKSINNANLTIQLYVEGYAFFKEGVDRAAPSTSSGQARRGGFCSHFNSQITKQLRLSREPFRLGRPSHLPLVREGVPRLGS
jgi:hypothetical protein